VTTPEITFRLLDGPAASTAASTADWEALHAEVCPDAAGYPARFRVQRRQPGFVLAEARHGGYLVGYASGMPLRPSTDWWQQLTAPLPAAVTTEHTGRTFAVLDLVVRASWRRQGIAATLHDLILSGRTEERATLKVPLAATAARGAFAAWGWRKVARAHSPAADVLVMALAPAALCPTRGAVSGADAYSR
jgi:GNAT superfamily N-acetyltransferase